MLLNKIRDVTKKLFIFDDKRTEYGGSLTGASHSYRADQFMKRQSTSSQSIVGAIFNKLALDVCSVSIQCVKLDDDDKTIKHIDTPTLRCFTHSANIDQTGLQFLHDLIYSMLDEGVVAGVPIVSDKADFESYGYSVYNIRTGKIMSWSPQHICVRCYNEETGIEEDITVPKARCLILENPLSVISSEAGSILQRLKQKLYILDTVESHSTGTKLDILIQVPHMVKSKLLKKEAEDRIKSIEEQLTNSKRGIAYIDAAERVVQLNRPAMNLLMDQIKDLTKELYNLLGLTENIMNGTASETEMLNYYNRTIDPILEFLIAEMNKKFLNETQLKEHMRFQYRRNPFKIVPVTEIAGIGDTMVRNRIMTPNEVRKLIGLNPSSDENADKLLNPNISDKNQDTPPKPDNNKNLIGGIVNEKKQKLLGSRKE